MLLLFLLHFAHLVFARWAFSAVICDTGLQPNPLAVNIVVIVNDCWGKKLISQL